MLEIYNEQVRDLLAKANKTQTGGLKIRQNPKSGFYVEGLKVLKSTELFRRLKMDQAPVINIRMYLHFVFNEQSLVEMTTI